LNREADPLRLYAILRSDLGMSPGKLASQAGHAYLDAYISCQQTDPDRATEYRGDSHGIKIALRAKSLHELLRAQDEAIRLGIPCALITDLGYTCFDGKPTITALGIGPARKGEIHPITKRFNLMS